MARAAWCVFFHVPLGGCRSRVEGAILKAIGTVAGVPDIICIFQGRVYALELKAGRGRVTDVQRVVHERLREAGANVAVAHGIDQALAQLERWQLLRGTSPSHQYGSRVRRPERAVDLPRRHEQKGNRNGNKG